MSGRGSPVEACVTARPMTATSARRRIFSARAMSVTTTFSASSASAVVAVHQSPVGDLGGQLGGELDGASTKAVLDARRASTVAALVASHVAARCLNG